MTIPARQRRKLGEPGRTDRAGIVMEPAQTNLLFNLDPATGVDNVADGQSVFSTPTALTSPRASVNMASNETNIPGIAYANGGGVSTDTRCIHCGGVCYERTCELCDPPTVLRLVCAVCHEELDHGRLLTGSLHFVGGRAKPTDRDDEDAFRKAER